MATVEQTRPPNGAPEGLGGNGAADSVVLHPYIYPSPLKTPSKPVFRKQLDKLTAKGLSKQDEKEALGYIQSLEAGRGALTSALESPSVSDQAVTDAASTYLGLLLGLVSNVSGSTDALQAAEDGAAPAADVAAASTPDEALSAVERGGSATSPLAATPSKLRCAVRFEWAEALTAAPPGAQPRTAAHPDALFELASVLVAIAVRQMHAAAAACTDSATGVHAPAVTRAYTLLRQAAGVLDFVAHSVLPLLPAGLSVDTDLQVVRALSTMALADAQQLTMLRAVAKGNAPALIASLAVDTASLYSQACSQLTSSVVSEARSCKLWHYGQYKQAYCNAHAHCFNGIALWKQQDKCGAGLKCLEAAAMQLAMAKRASAAYDSAPPASLNLQHRRVDDDLDHVIYDTQKRMKRENDTVYLQPMAAEVPELPERKRLISSLPYALPQPAAAVKEGVVDRCFMAGPSPPSAPTHGPVPMTMQSGAVAGPGTAAAGAAGAAATGSGVGGQAAGGKGEDQGCSCCRWTVMIICLPLLCVLWLLGAIIWVVLLPLKLCCPCCGFPLQWASNLVLWLMRAPARGLLWAAGKEDKGDKEQKN